MEVYITVPDSRKVDMEIKGQQTLELVDDDLMVVNIAAGADYGAGMNSML